MQHIADWLKKLGMSEYAERFIENDIDMAVLPDLTDQHLKDLGVSLGHRLKMLRAIRDLGDASVAVTAPSRPVETEPARQDDAERRQLTVMFTDLVGSTALSTKLDPEDMRTVIGAYHKRVAETVARFDGFVAKYMGDGVLILLWLSPGPRGRCGARRAGRANARRSGQQAARPTAAPGAHWHCDRLGGGWRSRRLRRGPGTRDRG
jgi:class 3 adenylate cyclase